MSPARTAATARRVLTQLRHDPRSIALIMVIPCVVLGIVAWMFNATPAVLDRFGPMLLAIFPAFVMFLVTSVTMLRERTSGTLERLMTTPVSKGSSPLCVGGFRGAPWGGGGAHAAVLVDCRLSLFGCFEEA
ncbi:MAG: ABC transporter permease, partial [Bifidobacteriaceae bacterium]|nr:ABC transporter permease [Bifidobacteriaceae bacterium]